MIINQITYIAKGQVAGLDDIITLRLKMLDRSGAVVGTKMISGHSIVLANTVHEIDPVDVDSILIEATDLDYEGHTLQFNNFEYTIPRTGSLTATFKVETVGAPEVAVVSAPGVEAMEAAMYPVPEAAKFTEVTGLPMPPEIKPAGIGAGAGWVILGVVALLAFGGRKKK